MCTVWPIFTVPDVGAISPASSRSRCVLPEPLTPMTPIRSPGPTCQVTWSSSVRSPTRHRDVLEVDDRAAEPSLRQRPQLDRAPGDGHVGDQRLGRVDAEPRLGRARRRPAAQPGQLLAQQVLPPGLGRVGLPRALGPGQHVGRVPAVELADGAVADLPRPLAHRVEEPAIVGDDEQRAAPDAQVLGQPGDALDVEVVGGLVEHQQVGLLDEGGGQGDPAALAAGQAGDVGVQPDGGQAEPVRGSRGPPRRRPIRARRRRRRRASRTVVAGGQVAALVDPGDVHAAGAGDPAGVGGSSPTIRRSSVDLPPPLRPTTPIRSPSATPSETPSSTTVVP